MQIGKSYLTQTKENNIKNIPKQAIWHHFIHIPHEPAGPAELSDSKLFCPSVHSLMYLNDIVIICSGG